MSPLCVNMTMPHLMDLLLVYNDVMVSRQLPGASAGPITCLAHTNMTLFVTCCGGDLTLSDSLPLSRGGVGEAVGARHHAF